MPYYAEILMMNNLVDKLLCATSYMWKSRRTLNVNETQAACMQQNESFNWWMAWNEIRLEQRQILQCCAHTVECCGWRTHTMCTPATHNVHIRHIISHWMVHFSTINTFSTLASPTAQHAASEHPSIPSSISRNVTSDTKCLINNGGIWEAQIGLFSL